MEHAGLTASVVICTVTVRFSNKGKRYNIKTHCIHSAFYHCPTSEIRLRRRLMKTSLPSDRNFENNFAKV